MLLVAYPYNIIYNNREYMFYEMIEKKGGKILDEYDGVLSI